MGPKGCPEILTNRLGHLLGITTGVPGLPWGALEEVWGRRGGSLGSFRVAWGGQNRKTKRQENEEYGAKMDWKGCQEM